jgi:GNAT superfamily N-acetyltransferase
LTTASFNIRPSREDDALAIGRLAQEFADYLRALGDQTDFSFGPDEVLRDGFGPNPAFAGIVAEDRDEILGYLLYHFGYDVDRGTRILNVIDLYVREDARRRGIGRALMVEAAASASDLGDVSCSGRCTEPNQLAADFYEALGARYVNGSRFARSLVLARCCCSPT